VTQFAFTLAASFGVGMIGVLLLRFLPTLRLQLAGLALLALALPLVTVLVSGLVMFEMNADLKILFLASGAATSVLVCAFALTRSIGRRVDELREAAQQLAAGDLEARAVPRGPAELAELAAAFNEMAANIDQLFAARRQLVAAASHDLRTPIAAIEAMHEAIEDGLVDADEYLPALRAQARSLRVLIDGLFELARIDASTLQLTLRDVALGDVVETCVRAVEVEALTHGVDLQTDLDPRVPPVRCAPEQIERVLANLLTNALRHTPAGGAISVRTEADSSEVRVLVEDDGTGLSPDAQARMFERFWREDRARSSRANSGLGLAIAKGLVEAHGGRIWAENRLEGGARVAFTLPLAA
jgi:two-component system, OmpR family, sensor histidine kinase SaeS